MARNRGHRERPRARRAPWREPKPRILCVCEGAITEPEYLQAFTAHHKNPRVYIEVDGGQGVPRTLVERAKRRKRDAAKDARRQSDDNLAFDEVWCVCDVDDHPKLDEARVIARDNGIKLAISNPCFELWLILHFRDNPGAQDRDHMTRILKGFLANYDKHVDFARVVPGYDAAVQRACRLDDTAGGMGRNPTTGVWRLTESIRGHDGSQA